MSIERRDQLIREICTLRDVPGVDQVLARGELEIDSFDVAIDHFAEDGDAVYVTFQYGIVTAGRTLRVFRLLLEANLAVYAQDQAQLGLEVATGAIVLIARVALTDEVDGKFHQEMKARGKPLNSLIGDRATGDKTTGEGRLTTTRCCQGC